MLVFKTSGRRNTAQTLEAARKKAIEIDTAITEKFGGLPPTELIARTLYLFSQVIKVAVEIAVMAADAGHLSDKEEIIAIAGTNTGADTAVVLRPAYSHNFFNLKIREVIAKPRQ